MNTFIMKSYHHNAKSCNSCFIKQAVFTACSVEYICITSLSLTFVNVGSIYREDLGPRLNQRSNTHCFPLFNILQQNQELAQDSMVLQALSELSCRTVKLTYRSRTPIVRLQLDCVLSVYIVSLRLEFQSPAPGHFFY